jgi:hypothetical protein
MSLILMRMGLIPGSTDWADNRGHPLAEMETAGGRDLANIGVSHGDQPRVFDAEFVADHARVALHADCRARQVRVHPPGPSGQRPRSDARRQASSNSSLRPIAAAAR